MTDDLKNDVVVDEVEVEEEVVEEVGVEQEVVEEEPEKPAFLEVEDGEDEKGDKKGSVPLAALLREKAKRKEKDAELEQLKEEIAKLRAQSSVKVDDLKVPSELDFDDPAEYQKAFAEYNRKVATSTFQSYEQEKRLREEAEKALRERNEAVEQHYKRAEELLKKHAISPDVYRDAEKNVREAVDLVMPGMSEDITDALISIVGEDSEKAMLYLGRNRSALAEFTMLLQKDKTGLKAAAYLGKIAGRMNGSTNRKTSQAPPPVPKTDGESGSTVTKNLQRKYNEAHKKGNVAEAYRIKKEAKAAGIDTSKW